MIWPTRTIVTDFDITGNLECDPDRIGQLLSNLLTNAITHGASDKPVFVNARMKGVFELSVINNGKPIPKEQIENLFEPFTRESSSPSQNGLGLGLFIASEIARAHGGQISVISNENHTDFTFRID